MSGQSQKKILVLAMKYFPASGGTSAYAYSVGHSLQRKGYDVLFLAPRYYWERDYGLDEKFKIVRMKFTDPKHAFLRGLVAMFYAIKYYRRFRPDVIWATNGAGVRVLSIFVLFRKFLHAKIVGTAHGAEVTPTASENSWRMWVEYLPMRLFYRYADAVVAVSHFTKNLKLSTGWKIPNIQVIYSGIPIDFSKHKTKERSLEKFPELKGKIVILTVCRLAMNKGLDTAITAIAKVVSHYPEAIYILVGEGPEKEQLQKQVTALNLEDHVVFAGYVSDDELEFYYGVCDIFIMPSRTIKRQVEGFGLTYIEAGIRGKPVIGTRHGGVVEAVSENRTGFLIEEENTDELAEKIQILIQKETLRSEFAANAKIYILENFSYDVLADNDDALIKKLLAHS
jgi:phosphatidylinositol alpha-1,6-mannosyltransferase